MLCSLNIGLASVGYACVDSHRDVATGSLRLALRIADIAEEPLPTPAGASLSGRENHATGCYVTAHSDRTRLGFGLDYQYTRYTYDGVSSRNRDLHRVQFPLSIRREYGGGHAIVQIAPGVAVSSNAIKDPFERLDRDSVLTTGRIEWRKPLDESAALQIGLAHDRRFGEPLLYPLIGLVLDRPSVRWRLVLPEPSVDIDIPGRWQLSARVYPAGSTWHVFTDDFSDTFRYRVRAVRAEVALSRQLGNRTRLDVTLGREMRRHHDFEDSAAERIRTEPDDATVLAFSVRFGRNSIPFAHYP